MYNISVLDKVQRPGIVSIDTGIGRFQHELVSPRSDKSVVLDLAPPLYHPSSKSKIYDRSSYSNHATINGATWTRLPSGLWALSFDGNDYIDTDIVLNDLAATTRGTWMTWAKFDDATSAANPYLVSFGNTDADEFIATYVGAYLYAQLKVAGAFKWYIRTTAVVLSDGIYAHIALVQNGTAPIFVVNGVERALTWITEVDKTVWFSGCAGLDNGRIGCISYNNNGNSTFLSGVDLSLEKFISENLTVAQVRDVYNQEKHLLGV